MKIETRKVGSLQIEEVEPQPGQPLRLSGVAATWERYDMGDCYEILDPKCFDASLAAEGDSIALLWNHDTSRPMGRVSSGNLKVYADPKRGLCFDCDLPDTDGAEEAHHLVEAGIVTQCSFGFICESEEYIAPAKGETKGTRVIKQAKLLEVSVVTFPANPATSVEARSEQPPMRRRIYLPPEY